MPRIRSLKPEYATSEAIAALTIECELHFAKLWTYCDDHGRGLDNPRLIKAAIWPLRDEVTVEQVAEWQDELEKHDRIVRYTWNGKNLFEVSNWSEHQKPQHAKDSLYPSFDSEEVIRKPHEDFSKPHEPSPKKAPVVVEGEGVVDVVGEGVSPTASFDTFWEIYPRHHANGKPGGGAPRNKTFDKWKRLAAAERDLCLTAVANYAEASHQPDAPYVAHATTWLNEKRWDDWLEPADYSKARGPAPPRDRFADMGRSLQERVNRVKEVGGGQIGAAPYEARRGLPAG